MIVLFDFRIAHNPIYRFSKRNDSSIWREGRSTFTIVKVQEYRTATGGASGIDVSPAVADQERAAEIDTVPRLGLQQQPGQRLAAAAAIPVVMGTDQKVVQRKGLTHGCVHGMNGIQGLGAACDVGLVGDHQQQETQVFQTPQAAGGVFDDFQLPERSRGVGLAVTHDGPVQNAIAIQKNRAPGRIQSRVQGRTDSHFVSDCFRAGWETMRCQTTA